MKKEEKLTISKENMKLLETLVMYAEDDLQFYKQITDYLYRLGHKLNDYKKEQIFQEKLHEMSKAINEVFKN